ncbi:MAG: matrixin family metalloprotease [Bdellovibrionota bacterium]
MGTGRFVVLCLLLLGACSKESGLDVHSCYEEYLCTSDGAIVRWNNAAITFSYEESAPEKLRIAVGDSANQYNDTFEQTDLLIDENDNRAPAYTGDYASLNRDGVNGIYYVTETWPWTSKIPGSLAVTLTRYTAQGIAEADIFIKADENLYGDDSPEASLPWITYITQHELGHSLGRSHSKEPSSLMYPSISKSKVVRLAGAEDFNNFFSEYDLELFALAYK